MQKTIHTPAYAELIKWLKQNRENKGMTMRDVAEHLDVSHSWIGKIEKLERRIDIYEYVCLCKCLGIDPKQGLKKLKI